MKRIILCLICLFLFTSCVGGSKNAQKKQHVKIGMLNNVAQILLSEIYAVSLERNGYKVDYVTYQNEDELVNAIDKKQVNMFIDFSNINDSFKNYQTIKRSTYENLIKHKNFKQLKPTKAYDSISFVVRKGFSTKYKISKLSQVEKNTEFFNFGSIKELSSNESQIINSYNLKNWKNVIKVNQKNRIKSLKDKMVDFVVGSTLDTSFSHYNYNVLKDDKNKLKKCYFVPLIDTEIYNSDLIYNINSVSNKLINKKLINMLRNYYKGNDTIEDLAIDFNDGVL